MSGHDREGLFDDWAATYEGTVERSQGFPFAGYAEVLAAVVAVAGVEWNATVLDIGCGTGMLARRFGDRGCLVLGIDFSSAMIARAKVAVPDAAFLRLDVLDSFSVLSGRRFFRIVSTYLFHEFDLVTKVALLQRLARDHLEPGGAMVIGDIAFATRRELDQERTRSGSAWDPDEHYWVAAEALASLAEAGISGTFQPVSRCAGLFALHPSLPQ